MRHPMFEHQCVLGGKVWGELWGHAVGWLLLSPSAHPTEGAQPGNAEATWMRVLGLWEWAGITLEQPRGRAGCWAGLDGHRAGEGRGPTGGAGGSPPRLVLGGGAGVPEEIQALAQEVEAPDLLPLRRAN